MYTTNFRALNPKTPAEHKYFNDCVIAEKLCYKQYALESMLCRMDFDTYQESFEDIYQELYEVKAALAAVTKELHDLYFSPDTTIPMLNSFPPVPVSPFPITPSSVWYGIDEVSRR